MFIGIISCVRGRLLAFCASAHPHPLLLSPSCARSMPAPQPSHIPCCPPPPAPAEGINLPFKAVAMITEKGRTRMEVGREYPGNILNLF